MHHCSVWLMAIFIHLHLSSCLSAPQSFLWNLPWDLRFTFQIWGNIWLNQFCYQLITIFCPLCTDGSFYGELELPLSNDDGTIGFQGSDMHEQCVGVCVFRGGNFFCRSKSYLSILKSPLHVYAFKSCFSNIFLGT